MCLLCLCIGAPDREGTIIRKPYIAQGYIWEPQESLTHVVRVRLRRGSMLCCPGSLTDAGRCPLLRRVASSKDGPAAEGLTSGRN